MREYLDKFLSIFKSPALGNIWRSTKGERGRLALLSLLNAFGALISLGFTLVMKQLVDAAVAGDPAQVRLYALIMAGVIIVMLANGYVRRIIVTRTKADLIRNMRADVLHTLLHRQYAGLQRYHSGELVNRVFSDVNVVANGIVGIVPPLLYLFIQLFGAVIILYRMNSGFMLILLLAGIFGAAASLLFRRRMKRLHKDAQQAEDKLHANIQETLGSLRIIKASGTEDHKEGQANIYQTLFIGAQMRRVRFSAFMNTALGIVFQGSWFYALLWGCSGIYHGTITYGTLSAILQLVGQIQSPFEGLISTIGEAYSTTSSAERLKELYDIPDEAEQPPLRPFREIVIDRVSFAYEEGETVLSDITLNVRRGDTMAITGSSGCGKSTLFHLLLGIYQPVGGSLTLDDGGAIPRALFAYVPQGNALFSGTLRENLALFCRETPAEDRLWQACERACIADFIRRQPAGLDTLIGERGLGLSEGQAQRIAIARALMTDSPVLLLDEATSALDEETEAAVLKNISEMKDRTCLIVTHRRAALAICNRVVSMNGGHAGEREISC